MTAFGGNVPGGFAEYCRYPARLCHRIGDLPWEEAVLVEPAACAAHGVERMGVEVGSRVLLFGCGPTGMLLAGLVGGNGAASVSSVSVSFSYFGCGQVLKMGGLGGEGAGRQAGRDEI